MATIIMGHRMSTHESLAHVCPYYVLFGRHPLLGRSIPKRLHKLLELDLDVEKVWVADVVLRAKAVKHKIPMTMKNMATAQARDRLRYAYTRGGTYTPKPMQYRVRDLVYVKRRPTDTLDCSAGRIRV